MTIVIEIPPFLDIIVAGFIGLFGFIGYRVVFRYMILPMAGHWVADYLRRKLRPTRRELIIIQHYRAKRRGKIHQARTPWLCDDGRCPSL